MYISPIHSLNNGKYQAFAVKLKKWSISVYDIRDAKLEVVSVVLVVRGTIFSVTSAFSAQGRGCWSRVMSSPPQARFHLWWNWEVLQVQSAKWIARICLCLISNVLFSIVVVHPRTALNAILLVLRLFQTYFLKFWMTVVSIQLWNQLGRYLLRFFCCDRFLNQQEACLWAGHGFFKWNQLSYSRL